MSHHSSLLSPRSSLPVQRRLDIKLDITGPLLNLGAVRGALDIDYDEILLLIADLKLAFAFNIAVEETTRQEIRVLTRCVRGYQTTSASCGLQHSPLEDVIGWILARDQKPFIYGTRLQSLFVCSSQLIIDLLRAGHLRTTSSPNSEILSPNSEPAWRRGRGGSPAITRSSVVQFLKKRRIQ